MPADTRSREELLLREVLELGDEAPVTMLSREPSGEGSVAGFTLAESGEELTYFVDTSGRAVDRETGLVLGELTAPEARVWLHPADPHLPALAPVAFSDAAATLLARLGVTATGAPRLVAYRAGRRAVLSVDAEGGRQWVKVVRPDRVERIVEAHRALAAAGVPQPALRGWSDDGLVVIDQAGGVPAADALGAAGGSIDPDALLDEVDGLRRRIAGAALRSPARTDMTRRLAWYADRLSVVLPGELAAGVARTVAAVDGDWESGDPVVIHGDLHFGQLFLDDAAAIAAVIDVDTAGVGAASDDTGAFLAHAIASAILTPPPRDERVWELARAAARRWDAASAPGTRTRAVAHLLGHALGAWETGAPVRAARILAAAHTVAAAEAHGLGRSAVFG
ncbi:hypothetical protein Q9S36_10080 [Microbacterium sp. ARD31]|uniref:hypothetical protein n=1 Tax=Microbacterium sp. ARD31 TaxID=2962576 RepID=UPI002881B7C9|nr:hypothetical protein [Microbacterium sp. ARD31]MDT0180551.1 hypothetical protein [Microbacterium sp. ARD31]